MSRKTFLALVSVVASAVALVAILFPRAILESKGAAVTPAALVWVREVGVLIGAQGVASFWMRRAPPSDALVAFLRASGVLQLALFPIEIIGIAQGALASAAGVVPNSIPHLVLGGGFLAYARASAFDRRTDG